MELLQQTQRIGDRHQLRRRFAGERELLAGVPAELPGNPERVERAEPVPELEQMLVVHGEQRTLQRREHRQLVVGPFDGGERRPNRLDFLAAVERLAADQQMRNPARLDGVDVRPRHVVAEADEAPEQHGDVPRLQRHARLAPVGLLLGDRPAVLRSISHAMYAPTASGNDVSIALADGLSAPKPPRPYGRGTGSATIAGCEASSGARTATTARSSACSVAVVRRSFPRANAALTNRWISGTLR